MTDTTSLAELIEQLHEVNRVLSEAAKPLGRVRELGFAQREQLGKQIRAGLELWEDVTKRIGEVLAGGPDSP